MPTTNDEASKIIQICFEEKVPRSSMVPLFRRLRDEVGNVSDNDSVKATMNMLYFGVSKAVANHQILTARSYFDKQRDQSTWLLLWGLLFFFHASVWFAMWTACVMSLINQPWYIAFVVVSFCFYLVFVETTCPLTVWENFIRRQLGWGKIGTFTGHYLLSPLSTWIK